MRKTMMMLVCLCSVLLLAQLVACDSGDKDEDVAATQDQQVEPVLDVAAELPPVGKDAVEPPADVVETNGPPDVAAAETAMPELVEETAGPVDVVLVDVVPVDVAPELTTEVLMLSSGHSGWKQPKCLTCHPSDGHNDGLDPYQCVNCHGTNGASNGHGKSTCSACHPDPHGATGFPTPDSCIACHP